MTAAEAHAAAAAEGLALLRAENATGFKGECRRRTYRVPNVSKPFKASLRHGGRTNSLGFATAEEAALAVARFLGPEGVAGGARAGAAPERPPEPTMTAAEAHRGGGAGGLTTLLRAENATGFKGVRIGNNVGGKPFRLGEARIAGRN